MEPDEAAPAPSPAPGEAAEAPVPAPVSDMGYGACCFGCCGWWRGVTYKQMTLPGDTDDDVERKLAFCFFYFVCGCVCLAIGIGAATAFMTSTLLLAAGLLLAAVAVALFLQRVPKALFTVALLTAMSTVVAVDVSLMATGSRRWSIYIIIIDFLLVYRVPRVVSSAVVLWVIAWLCIAELELTFRFGLLDLPGMDTYADRREEACACEKLPCPRPRYTLSAGYVAYQILVLVVDFLLTRGFATQMATEREKVEASVHVAEILTGALARFDLEAAEAYLAEEEQSLPKELVRHFNILLSNLASYRPFLPGEFFGDRASAPQHSPGAANPLDHAGIPGTVDPRVTIMFTDIKSSSALWEHSEEGAMVAALRVHNNTMRRCIAEHGGYEVKTIGDAFMVTYHSPVDAVRCAAAAQRGFAELGLWPEGLRRPDASDGYGLLCVRIGIHVGEMVIERNVISGRFDYFGTAVNKAARVEAHGVAGAVVVTSEVIDSLTEDDLEDLYVVPYTEARIGKGLAAPLWLTALVPRAMGDDEAARVRSIVQGDAARLLGAGSRGSQRTGMSAGSAGNLSDTVRSFKERSSSSLGSRAKYSSASMVTPTPDGRAHQLRIFAPASSSATPAATHLGTTDLLTRASRASATIGVVTLGALRHRDEWADLEARMCTRLEVAHRLLRVTNGLLSKVVSDTAVMTWGLQRQTRQHVNESTRFLMAFFEELRAQGKDAVTNDTGTSDVPFHAGFTTAPAAIALLAPSVGQRFVTILGPGPALAQRLCARAWESSACVLTAAATDESHAEVDFLRPHVECVGTMRVQNVRDTDAPVESSGVSALVNQCTARGAQLHVSDDAEVEVFKVDLGLAAGGLRAQNLAAAAALFPSNDSLTVTPPRMLSDSVSTHTFDAVSVPTLLSM
eukprot:TRINITY_DN32938_c0_g1_i1.p1 TRINITY_DN32938_c0_g1~~TRINITY_DN32938_c0_g1_i1.p1  ORF type:complete len:905 (+),score=200.23 TRINITY_DN32938_c0_g1_i1:56-2770(+)